MYSYCVKYLKVYPVYFAMSQDRVTTIKLKESTKTKLSGFGKKGETYDEILNKLVEIIEEKECAKNEGTR